MRKILLILILSATQLVHAYDVYTSDDDPPHGDYQDGQTQSQTMDRLFVLDSRVSRSSQPQTLEHYAKLKSLGVKTIINLRYDNSVPENGWLAIGLGFRFLNFPITDPSYHVRADIVEKAYQAMLDPANQPVHVHCRYGKDRTGLLIALYRVREMRWTPEGAFSEWRELGMVDDYGPSLSDYFWQVTGVSNEQAKIITARVDEKVRCSRFFWLL